MFFPLSLSGNELWDLGNARAFARHTFSHLLHNERCIIVPDLIVNVLGDSVDEVLGDRLCENGLFSISNIDALAIMSKLIYFLDQRLLETAKMFEKEKIFVERIYAFREIMHGMSKIIYNEEEKMTMMLSNFINMTSDPCFYIPSPCSYTLITDDCCTLGLCEYRMTDMEKKLDCSRGTDIFAFLKE